MKKRKAVIYCRVSSGKQAREGNGITSQEVRCREYAKHNNLDVVEVFRDEGYSGKLVHRPNLDKMLALMEKSPCVIIIDDINRFARGLETHLILRKKVDKLKCTLESPSLNFGEDADSKLVENLLACVAEHGRGKNAEQVKNRMRARLLNGCWTFSKCMPGYKFQAKTEYGKLLVKDDPVATLVKTTLEGFVSGRFQTLTDIQTFLERNKYYPKNKHGGVYLERIRDLVTCILYAGYIEYPKWNVPITKGKHEAIISLTTYNKIQDKLANKGRNIQRKDLNKDFPLRGYVLCIGCRKPLTASWSTGRSAKHPYYRCKSKSCTYTGKSIRKDKIETEFRLLLAKAAPTPTMIQLVEKVVKEVWKKKRKEFDSYANDTTDEIKSLDTQLNKLMDRLIA